MLAFLARVLPFLVPTHALSAASKIQPGRFQHAGTGPAAPQLCAGNITADDIVRPIRNVLADHGAEGSCYFAPLGEWVSACRDAHGRRDFLVFADRFGPYYELGTAHMMQLFPSGPLRFTYEGGTRTVRTHWRQFPYDDAYCDALGWSEDLPKDRVTNYTHWQDLATSECDRLLGTYPEFRDLSLETFYHGLDRSKLAIAASASSGNFGGPSMKALAAHAAAKCLLGTAACDMANCRVNFCRLGADGSYGHGRRDCGPVPRL